MNSIYCGPPPLKEDIWISWNFDLVLILSLIVLAFVVRAKPSGLVAVAVLVLAFVSPLCALSSALFAARVVHHVLLVAVAAPLLAMAFPARKAGALAIPFAVSAIVLWGWHYPVAYDGALSNVMIYWVMQFTLLASAIWFWRSIFAREDAPVERVVYVVAGFAQMGMLGAILTFAPTQLYAAHVLAPYDWGFTPLADQQLGGLIMWVPAGLPYAVAAVVLARRSWGRLSGATA